MILEVNRRNVTSAGELKQLLAKYKGGATGSRCSFNAVTPA
ncbi:MAG: hypothetical protein AB1Z31_05220 [Desulfobacterales bacterium]